MSKYDIVLEKPVEMVELSDETMEAVAGGGFNFNFLSNSYISNSNLFVVFQFDSYFGNLNNFQRRLKGE